MPSASSSVPASHAGAPLDVTVIGFDAGVSVLPTFAAASRTDLAFSLQFADRSRVAAIPINGQHVRRPVVRICERGLQEPLGRLTISGFRQIEVNYSGLIIDGTEPGGRPVAQRPTGSLCETVIVYLYSNGGSSAARTSPGWR